MRKSRRILSLVLAVMVAATGLFSTAFATETTAAETETLTSTKAVSFSDVAENAPYGQAVRLLSLMGIINGYPDGTFGPDKNVTRAEFTAMLMRTLNYGGIGSASADKLPFSDVKDDDSANSWAIPDINTAFAKGIINGYEDGTFKPSANVSYEEALKMIVYTLGYVMDVSGTPWYGEYVAQANKLGITDVANDLGAVETPASRACIAQMLFDSLEVELIEGNRLLKKTILTDYLGYTRSKGIVTSNGSVSLVAPDVELRDDEIQIGSRDKDTGNFEAHTYRITDMSLKKAVGHSLDFYYKKDSAGVRVLEVYVASKTNEVVIEADAINEGTSGDLQIRYYKSESDRNTTAATLASDNVVIYNGKMYGMTAAQSRFSADMLPKVGSVTLLDSDGDNQYDIINIENYEVYYVSSKLSAEYSILDDVTKIGEGKKLILNVDAGPAKTVIVDKNGNEISYNSIAVGNVICLATSNEENGGAVLRKAVVINDTVSGTVASVTGSSLTIGGTKYSFSKAAPWMMGLDSSLPEPALQDSGVYYKDINGNIVAYKKNTSTENVFYGYIMGVQKASSVFDSSKYLRVLTQSGSIQQILLQNGVRFDGASESCTVAEAEELLGQSADIQNTDDNSGYDLHQLIKYTTKTTSDGVAFEKIYRAAETEIGNAIENDKLYYYGSVSAATKSMKYNNASKKMTGNGVTVDVSGATVFMVPNDRGNHDDYAKTSLSSAFQNDKSYAIEVFDVSKTNMAKVVICYGGDSSTDVNDSTPVYVLTEEPALASNNGQAMTQLISLTHNGDARTSWLSDSSPWTPQLGDIYRPGTDKEGYTSIEEDNVLYRVGADNTFGIKSNNMSAIYGADYTVILGSVVARDDEGFAVLPQRIEENQLVSDISSALNFTYGQFNSARVLFYNESGDKLTIDDVSAEKDGALKSLVEYDAEGVTNPSKVLIHMVNGGIRMICILDKNA